MVFQEISEKLVFLKTYEKSTDNEEDAEDPSEYESIQHAKRPRGNLWGTYLVVD